MSATESMLLKMNEAVVQVSSNHAPLMGFLRSLLSRIEVEGETPDVRSHLQWVCRTPLGRRRAPLGGELSQVAAGVYGQDDVVGIPYVPGFPGFSARYQGAEQLQVAAQLIYQVPWDRLRALLGRYAPNYFLTRLMYHVVYVPAAWYLGRNLSRFWFHAGAVTRGDKALLVGGLAGIGKSTLCLRLIEDDQFELLSDDLLFYDEREVHTCYEPVRLLDPTSKEGQQARLLAMGNKYAFEMPQQLLRSARPTMLVLLRFGPCTRLEELASAKAAERLYATSRLAAQVSEFDYYATVLCTYFEIDDWYSRQMEQLRGLLSDVACFVLYLSRDDGPEKAYEAVREAANGIF